MHTIRYAVTYHYITPHYTPSDTDVHRKQRQPQQPPASRADDEAEETKAEGRQR